MNRRIFSSSTTKLENASKSTLGWMMKGVNRFFVSESKHFKDQVPGSSSTVVGPMFSEKLAPETILLEATDKFRRMLRLAVAVPALQVGAVVVLVPMLVPDAIPPWDAFLARYFPSVGDRGKKKQPFWKRAAVSGFLITWAVGITAACRFVVKNQTLRMIYHSKTKDIEIQYASLFGRFPTTKIQSQGIKLNTETGLPWMTYWAGESSIFKLSPNMVKFTSPKLFDSVMLGTIDGGVATNTGSVVAKLTAPPTPTVSSATNTVTQTVTKAVNNATTNTTTTATSTTTAAATSTATPTATQATQTATTTATNQAKPIINAAPTSKYAKPALKKKSAATKK